MAQSEFILITEAALDAALNQNAFDDGSMLPIASDVIHSFPLGADVTGFRVAREPATPIFALIGKHALAEIRDAGGAPGDAYRRIARVIKGLRSPPVHLPRPWSEYHFKNLLAFFALPRDVANLRWIAEIRLDLDLAVFGTLTSEGAEKDLRSYSAIALPKEIESDIAQLLSQTDFPESSDAAGAIAEEFDLDAIGSKSVVEGKTFEEWFNLLSDSQKRVLENDPDRSIRIVGPAGSGKTLALCMRAVQIARHDKVQAQGKRLLVATHSWAMADRIDGIIGTLNGGTVPPTITVWPLLTLLENYTGYIGQQRTNVIGDDSTEGRVKSLDIINEVLVKLNGQEWPDVSDWIKGALASPSDSRQRIDLALNVYEEISGVLTASGVSPDDHEAIQEYLKATREDWMPPFDTMNDRAFVVSVYKAFMLELLDRGAITTDQFVIDSIRVLETFAWRMRKETEGYDYIFADELQLFDPQERTSLELLGRSRLGIPFITAEDPAQGVFSALNSRRARIDNEPLYLEVVHRFNEQIFQFISFIYQKFPLNALPLRIDAARGTGARPELLVYEDEYKAIKGAAHLVSDIQASCDTEDRVCVATLGDVDADIAAELEKLKLNVTKLDSFDDVERLAYSKRSTVVAPWQFIGGTQFSHVIVLALNMGEPNSQFSRLREMVAVYLACSRATERLTIVSAGYLPNVIAEAADAQLITTTQM